MEEAIEFDEPRPARASTGTNTWDQDSEWYHVGIQRDPEGAVWADKAIAARAASRAKAFAYARKALESSRAAWAGWYSAFTGIPLNG